MTWRIDVTDEAKQETKTFYVQSGDTVTVTAPPPDDPVAVSHYDEMMRLRNRESDLMERVRNLERTISEINEEHAEQITTLVSSLTRKAT